MICECIQEPRGEYNLEGYRINEEYFYEWYPQDEDGKPYCKIYPYKLEENTNNDSSYYKICSFEIFKKYFKRVLK